MRAFIVAIAAFTGLATDAISETGHHISCHTSGSLSDGKGSHKDIDRTLSFYLDDVNAKIVAEQSNLTVSTKSYSDSNIEANVQDGGLPIFPVAIFGNQAKEPAVLNINRISGQIVIAAALYGGADVEVGTCESVLPSGKAKF